jgi:hypothetical protein
MDVYARVKLAEFLIEQQRPDEAQPLLEAAAPRISDNEMVPDTKKQEVREMLAKVSAEATADLAGSQ